MKVTLSNKPINIKRRFKRLAKFNPSTELTNQVQSLNSSSTPKENLKVSRAVARFAKGVLKEQQKQLNKERKAKRLTKLQREVRLLGVAKPGKNEAQLKRQIKEIKRINRRVETYIQKQKEFNSKAYPSFKASHVLQLMPTNDKELREAYKLLNKARKANSTDTIMETLRAATNKPNAPVIEASRAMFTGNYRKYTYFKTAIQEAEKSPFPELADLLRMGGENFTEELIDAGFTLFEYAESLTDGGTSRDSIISSLFAVYTMGRLSPSSAALIAEFVNMYK